MRNENGVDLPEPVDLKQLEISKSETNLEDADLDLTLVDDINNTKVPQSTEPVEQQQQQSMEQCEAVPEVIKPNQTLLSTATSQTPSTTTAQNQKGTHNS